MNYAKYPGGKQLMMTMLHLKVWVVKVNYDYVKCADNLSFVKKEYL